MKRNVMRTMSLAFAGIMAAGALTACGGSNTATQMCIRDRFLMNAQGEDVVAGVRTPQKIDQLKEVMPEVYEQFVCICHTLEDHYRDMQDMEFTIEDRKLYMLQTRNGKRTAKAALKIACDLVDEGMIDEKKAVKMIDQMCIRDRRRNGTDRRKDTGCRRKLYSQ